MENNKLQNDQFVVQKMADKYLELRNKCWYFNFRIPKKLGNDRIRTSLKTSNIKTAREIRDKIIIPVLYADSVVSALEEIARKIQVTKVEIQDHITNIKNTIFNNNVFSIYEAINRYNTYLIQSTLRPSSKKSYINSIQTLMKYIDGNRNLNTLTKKDATTARDKLLKELSATRTTFCFQSIRKFLRWCKAEGLICDSLADCFLIPLPTPIKEHKPDIPTQIADQAL